MGLGIMTRLDDIRDRAEAATPGPWEARTTGRARGDHWYVCDACEAIAHISAQDGINEDQREPDAEFIAHAREDVPALLAALDAVLALHSRTCETSGPGCDVEDCPMMVCGPCGEDWPCPSVRAVSAALGGGE